MSTPAVRTAVHLRRLWLTEVVGSAAHDASDLADLDVRIRRVARRLVVSGPRDFGDGDPFDGALGDLLRLRLAAASEGAVTDVVWQYDELTPLRRVRTTDLDVLDPGDPSWDEYPRALARLRSFVPPGIDDRVRAALARASLAAVSRHRVWLAVAADEDASAFAHVPGARAALVAAIQRFQRNELPLYRVVVDRAAWRGEWTL